MTPSENLILEVLAARARLGHRWWPIHKTHKRTLNSLVEKKLVHFDLGHTEDSFDVSLTDEGRKQYLTDGYKPPIYPYMKDEFKDSFFTGI